MDAILLLTVAAFLGYVLVAQDTIEMLTPEKVVEEALKGFDSSWLEVIRHEWRGDPSYSRLHICEDPFILLERILVSTLERGDINSFTAAMILIRNHINEVAGKDDGGILDNYLSDKISSVIQVATEHHAENALMLLVQTAEDITTPTDEALRNSEIKAFTPALGTHVLRQIVDAAISSNISEVALQAIYSISRRADAVVHTLPASGDTLFFGDPNRELSAAERKVLMDNNFRITNYVENYIHYFGNIGKLAITRNLPDVSQATTYSLTDHISKIASDIPSTEERMQVYFINSILYNLLEIVKAACEKNMKGVLFMGTIDIGNITSKIVTRNIANALSLMIVTLARGKILSGTDILGIPILSYDLAKNNPEAVIPIIEAFGEAGTLLISDPNQPQNNEYKFVQEEILKILDTIAVYGMVDDQRAKVEDAVRLAKLKIQQSMEEIPQS
jgi:hypothetical protein